ncbi:MAG: COG1470 family protein [Rubripirellula sp.]
MTCLDATAQVKLDRFFPPAVEVGSESQVKAEGKFPKWPVIIDVDRDDVEVKANEGSGSLTVRASEDAAPGVVWVRIRDAASASSLVPLLIERSVITEEVEPNNKLSESTEIDLPCVAVGRLSKSGDLDSFSFEVSEGQTLVISVVAHRLLKSPMDAVAQLVDEKANVLQQVDDRRGLDPQIVYRADRDARLTLRLFAFPETPNSTIGYAGSASFVYMVRITTDAFVDHVLPLVAAGKEEKTHIGGWNLDAKNAVKYSPATSISPRAAYVPGALGWQWLAETKTASDQFFDDQVDQVPHANRFPCQFSGRIRTRGEIDRYHLSLKKGTRYRIGVDSRRFGFLLDSVLRLVNPEDGNELARNDDASRNQFDAALEYSAKEDATIELQVSDLVDGFGMRHAYSVIVEEVKPSFSLTVAADHFEVVAGASVDVPVSVSRRGGFNSSITVDAESLPEGVTCEPAESEAKGGTAKTVTLKLKATESASAWQGAFRVTGRAIDKEGKASAESTKATYALREVIAVSEFWLTVAEKK